MAISDHPLSGSRFILIEMLTAFPEHVITNQSLPGLKSIITIMITMDRIGPLFEACHEMEHALEDDPIFFQQSYQRRCVMMLRIRTYIQKLIGIPVEVFFTQNSNSKPTILLGDFTQATPKFGTKLSDLLNSDEILHCLTVFGFNEDGYL